VRCELWRPVTFVHPGGGSAWYVNCTDLMGNGGLASSKIGEDRREGNGIQSTFLDNYYEVDCFES
jgi:hypothetical protein